MGWVESMKGVEVMLSYQHYSQSPHTRSGKREKAGDKNGRGQRDKYREDIFGDALTGGILDILFAGHLDFIIRIPSIGIEHQNRITNHKNLIPRIP